ncbi:MAG: LysM peptidoglycan-binding domain-containing protein [Frankia sp.]|nr:LysM peptidoglycan-binding domain-containing protein [Frankia sp.]
MVHAATVVGDRQSLDALVGSVAMVALLGVLAWLALVALAMTLTRVPGAFGSVSARLAARVAPAVVRRGVAAVIGLAVTAGTGVPARAAAGPPLSPAQTAQPTRAASLSTPTPQPAVPAAGPFERPAAPALAPTGSVLASPTPSTARAPGGPLPTTQPSSPRAALGATTARTPVANRLGARGARRVVVVPGDTLWAIAARRLPGRVSNARIAASWPRWWQANRRVIGSDPDLIFPGQRLDPPT